eukprot:CAMPEP_0195512258 /NCGR_PEP_ID=MMETSP0794_2-20130614/4278_1 /TAXON_ID=515487 /ORGANISM="Stephanopyxis turris, Strain CCMP 815" /LENGTH=403 /DNA_ID=CAMNT_0040639999 /DNA_START=203 /DNA_END=1414 /DNA_ORIENTATION=-
MHNVTKKNDTNKPLGFVPFDSVGSYVRGISSVKVTLHSNGDEMTYSSGTDYSDEDGSSPRAFLPSLEWDEYDFNENFAEWRLFSDQGESIRSFHQLQQLAVSQDNHYYGGDYRVPSLNLYRVPRTTNTKGQFIHHFFWPTRPIGDIVTVHGIDTPTDQPIELEMVSSTPRVFHVHNFVSEAEVDQLTKRALDPKNPYSVRSSTTGIHGYRSSTRTSDNAFDIDSPISLAIKHRTFQLLRVEDYDETMADGVQIVRFKAGQAYAGHHDWYPVNTGGAHNWDPREGGSNRYATLVIYLSDRDSVEGGQIVFPSASSQSERQKKDIPPSANRMFNPRSWERALLTHCYHGLSVSPKRGSAVLYYTQHPDGTLDNESLSGDCPVLDGVKWTANMWVWNACRLGMCDR